MIEVISILGTTVTLYDFFSRAYLKNQARRRLALAVALKRPADLRAALGDTIDVMWPYYERIGYFPIDMLRRRRGHPPVVVPGPALSEEMKPLHQPLRGTLVPTRPILISRKVVRLLSHRPEKILRDIHPVENPGDVTRRAAEEDQSQVVFLHKKRPHIGCTEPSTLEDLLDLQDLSVPSPAPIVLYPPGPRDSKLLQIRAWQRSIFHTEEYTLVLTRQCLRMQFRSRRKRLEVPREMMLWLRLDERSEILTVSTLFHDHRICAPVSDLRQLRDLLLGM